MKHMSITADTRYLYRQGQSLYFRRRIPGFSTRIAPVVLPLGTTDRKSAFIWLGRLVTEFDRMLETLSFAAPHLPEELIHQYMRTSLKQVLSNMRMDLRLERFTGRGLQIGKALREAQKLAVQTLLEEGVHPQYPPHRIDPAWSSEYLADFLRVYELEYQSIMAPDARRTLAENFTESTGVTLNSMYHHAQIREAALKVRFAALTDVTRPTSDALLKEVDALVSDAIDPGPQTLPAVTIPDNNDVPNNPPLIASVPPALPVTPDTLPEPNRITDDLTIGALIEQFDRAEAAVATNDADFGPDLAGIFWRMARQDGLSKDVSSQRASDLRLFCFVTGVQSIKDLQQWHMRRYADALKEIPKNFLRSAHDKNRSYAQVKQIAATLPKDDVGRAPDTVKRHLKTLELVLERAQSEGHKLTFTPDVKKLAPKQKGQALAHKRRSVFRLDEARAVFAHSLWQGHKSPDRRHEPGKFLEKDSRYWIPLILAYTGARRAEIAGLAPSDIGLIDGIPAITIQAHEWRGIKGEAPGTTDPRLKLTRTVPIHEHLLELGLMEHASAMLAGGRKLLFPDVVPKPGKKKRALGITEEEQNVEKFGETIDYMWRKSLVIALHGNPRELCMHSLRHYVNDTLIHAEGVHDVTRVDLLGHVESDDDDPKNPKKAHAKRSINTSTYRDDVPMSIKHIAIKKLPRLF
jgi:integrase